MISTGKRWIIVTLSIIFFVLSLVVSFLIGAQGGPVGYINIFSFIIPLIGVIQFEAIMFVLVMKPAQVQLGKLSLKKTLMITGGVGIVFIVIGLVIDAYRLPPDGGPYISSYGDFWIIVGCIFIAMIVGTYVREKMFKRVYK